MPDFRSFVRRMLPPLGRMSVSGLVLIPVLFCKGVVSHSWSNMVESTPDLSRRSTPSAQKQLGGKETFEGKLFILAMYLNKPVGDRDHEMLGMGSFGEYIHNAYYQLQGLNTGLVYSGIFFKNGLILKNTSENKLHIKINNKWKKVSIGIRTL
jgi:hypothetical protein